MTLIKKFMTLRLVILVLALTFIACKSDPNKSIDEGEIEQNIYHSEEIGWTIEIPEGWDIVQRDVLEKRTDVGLKAINETAGIDYDISGLKLLLNFQKGRFHIFQSSSEPFELEYEGEWLENNYAIKELLYETFTSRGIKIDTSSSQQKIDNLEFEVFHLTLFGPDDKIIMYQDMYARHINGYDFGVNISYIDDKKKDELMTAWKNSKFKQSKVPSQTK